MAFLAVNPDGASAEAISEALWPGADASHGTGQRNLALRKARDMLRGATGKATPRWILHASGRYRLDPTLISTDLWQFTAALDQAHHAVTDDDRLTACREAAGLYHGELAEGEGYDWAEPYAETARRRALDAWTTIADILAPSDPGQALAALESALGHDPYNEYLYQKIMRLQAAAGHPEAVRRTLSLLETRLADLGITPGTQTRHVAASLLGTHNPPPQPPARRMTPRRAPTRMSAAPPDNLGCPRPGQPRLSIWPRPWTGRRAGSPATITANPASAARSRRAAASPPGTGPVPCRRRRSRRPAATEEPSRGETRAGPHSAPSASPGSVAYTCRHRNTPDRGNAQAVRRNKPSCGLPD